MRKIWILLLVVPALNGCGTFVARTGWRTEVHLPKLYPATAEDIRNIRRGAVDPYNIGYTAGERIGMFVGGVLDTPFSLITDTLCLPYDLWIAHEKDQTCE